MAWKRSADGRIFDTFVFSPVEVPNLGPGRVVLVGDPCGQRGRQRAFTLLYESDAVMTAAEIKRLTRKGFDAEIQGEGA